MWPCWARGKAGSGVRRTPALVSRRPAVRQARSAMTKYSKESDSTKSCKARGSDLRVHFKVSADLRRLASAQSPRCCSTALLALLQLLLLPASSLIPQP